MNKPVWLVNAACRGVETNIFFPISDDEAQPAKEICFSCPVRESCLEWAINTRQREGILGGATERERRRIIRQRRKSA